MQIGVPPSSGVAFISLPSISAATFPNYVSKSVFLAMQSHQCVRRGLVETPVPVRCGSPCRLRLTTSPSPRSADSASSSHLSGCFSDGLTPGASYCMHHLAPQMLFLKTPTFQRLSLSPAEAPLTPNTGTSAGRARLAVQGGRRAEHLLRAGVARAPPDGARAGAGPSRSSRGRQTRTPAGFLIRTQTVRVRVAFRRAREMK